MTDPTTILREAIRSALVYSSIADDPDAVLAARIPQACQTQHYDNQSTGLIERIATAEEVDDGCELGFAFDACPDCPTIGTLLLYGWNVASARVEGGWQVSVSGKLWMTAPNLLAALREVMP